MKSREDIVKELNELRVLKDRMPYANAVKFDNKNDLDLDTIICVLEWVLR